MDSSGWLVIKEEIREPERQIVKAPVINFENKCTNLVCHADFKFEQLLLQTFHLIIFFLNVSETG